MSLDEGRWLEGSDDLTERERMDALTAMEDARSAEEAEQVWDHWAGGRW